jgi:hypothetical protein
MWRQWNRVREIRKLQYLVFSERCRYYTLVFKWQYACQHGITQLHNVSRNVSCLVEGRSQRIYKKHCTEFLITGYKFRTTVIINNPIFWDKMPCSPLTSNRLFGGICRLHLQGCLLSASCWFLAWLFLRPWKWKRHVSPRLQLIFNGLHGLISQKIWHYQHPLTCGFSASSETCEGSQWEIIASIRFEICFFRFIILGRPNEIKRDRN